MTSKSLAWCAVLSACLWLSCQGSDSAEGGKSNAGICASTCLKECAVDNDCEVTSGELCCDYAGVGKACLAANQCPRSCTSDGMCDTELGQACVRPTLKVPARVCAPPSQGIAACEEDSDCNLSDKCCGIYSQSVCLPANRCPKICEDQSECDTLGGEICCTTLGQVDSTVTASGLCVSPTEVNCPTLCESSIDCRTQQGELCCDGICSPSCEKSCDTSNDCPGQICCKSAVAKARGFSAPEGYPVTAHFGGGGFGGLSAGGMTGTAGRTGTGGTTAMGGRTGVGGAISIGGTAGSGGTISIGGTGGSGGIDTPGCPDNLALEAAVDAQTTFPGYDAVHVTDGDRNTALGGSSSWANNWSPPTIVLPQWFDIDLGLEQTFTRIDVYTTASYPISNYELYYWDGAEWVLILEELDNTLAHVTHRFDPVTSSRIRILGIRGPDAQVIHVRLNEVEVCDD